MIQSHELPKVSELDIYAYFVFKHSSYTSVQLKAYKRLNVHKYVQAGFVEEPLSFKINDEHYVIRIKVGLNYWNYMKLYASLYEKNLYMYIYFRWVIRGKLRLIYMIAIEDRGIRLWRRSWIHSKSMSSIFSDVAQRVFLSAWAYALSLNFRKLSPLCPVSIEWFDVKFLGDPLTSSQSSSKSNVLSSSSKFVTFLALFSRFISYRHGGPKFSSFQLIKLFMVFFESKICG